MGFYRHYFKEHNFLLSKISGDIDGKILMQNVLEINQEVEGISNLKELGDCRGVTGVKSLSTQMTADSARSEKNKPGSKLAILVSWSASEKTTEKNSFPC